jgi:hypothetical protein
VIGTAVDVDPFDLPEWLGSGEVTWSAESGIHNGHRVTGSLRDGEADPIACDLFAVDEAYPAPVTDDATRLATHRAWRHGQIRLAAYDDRLTLLVPGTCFTADLVLDALARLAKAVGARPESYTAQLRIGG